MSNNRNVSATNAITMVDDVTNPTAVGNSSRNNNNNNNSNNNNKDIIDLKYNKRTWYDWLITNLVSTNSSSSNSNYTSNANKYSINNNKTNNDNNSGIKLGNSK